MSAGEMNKVMDSFLALTSPLIELGESIGLEIHISVAQVCEGNTAVGYTTHQRHRQEFAWLQAYLTENPYRIITLRGNYVATYFEQIISKGPDEELTRIGAAKRIDIPPAQVLVVPIEVPGSEQCYENLRASLGME